MDDKLPNYDRQKYKLLSAAWYIQTDWNKRVGVAGNCLNATYGNFQLRSVVTEVVSRIGASEEMP